MSYVYTEEGDEEKYNELLDKRYNFFLKNPQEWFGNTYAPCVAILKKINIIFRIVCSDTSQGKP